MENQKQCEEKLKIKTVVTKWKTKKIYIESKIKKDDNEIKPINKPDNRIYFK